MRTPSPPSSPEQTAVLVLVRDDAPPRAQTGDLYDEFIQGVADHTPPLPRLATYLASATLLLNELAPHTDLRLDDGGTPVPTDTPAQAALVARPAADIVLAQEALGLLAQEDADVVLVQLCTWADERGATDDVIAETWSGFDDLTPHPLVKHPYGSLPPPPARAEPRGALQRWRARWRARTRGLGLRSNPLQHVHPFAHLPPPPVDDDDLPGVDDPDPAPPPDPTTQRVRQALRRFLGTRPQGAVQAPRLRPLPIRPR